jgi:hypothetical protein
MTPQELDQLADLAIRYAEEKRLSNRELFSAAMFAGAMAAQDARNQSCA